MKMTLEEINQVITDIENAIKDDALYSVVSGYDAETFKRKLGIPLEIKFAAYGSDIEFPIPLALKVRLVRYVVDRLRPTCYEYCFVGRIFRTSTRSIDMMYSGKIPDIAVACDAYFVQREITLKDLRYKLSAYYLDVKFNRAGLFELMGSDLKSLKYCLISRIKLTRSQLRKLFGLKSSEDSLLDKFYL